MDKHQRVSITVSALRDSNMTQLDALRENVLAEGKWETTEEVNVWMDMGTVMVAITSNSVERPFIIGIEKDGYTHS